MRRTAGWTAGLGLLFFAAACAALADGSPPQAARTAVPTWTLPFRWPAQPTPTPFQPGPANTLVVVTDTPVPSETPIPTDTPTPRPGVDPTLGAATPNPTLTPELPIPEPMPVLDLGQDVVNILLLGRDTARDSRSYRTDVMIVVSVNKRDGYATMLTIPRDLFVYIPGWTMNRINTAAGYGDAIRYPGGGVALLEQTILYNLGLPIHGWARVDFAGFQNVVDVLGGVDVPVTCQIQEWKLSDHAYPLDDQDPNHWELYTLEPGVHHLDGYLALWYARSRKRSSDFDRSRRQHQVLRALFTQALQLGTLPKVPELYAQYNQVLDTDLGLGDVLQFVPLAPKIGNFRIKSRFIGRDQVLSYTTSQGAQVLLPDREAITRLMEEAFQPPPENVLAREAAQVEVWNGTPNAGWELLAADNLAWAGIEPVLSPADSTSYATTRLYDFTTSAKGSPRKELQRIFRVADANVISQPDANAPHPFRVVLGADYNSCVTSPGVARAAPTPTPGPAASPDQVDHAAAVLEPKPPTDGDLGEWTFLVHPLNEPTTGAENRLSTADLSGQWDIAWDETYLFIAMQVKDDGYLPTRGGADMFRGDSLEIWLDTAPDQRGASLTERSFQLGIAPGSLDAPLAVAEAYLWHPAGQAGKVDGILLGVRAADGGYHLEVAVPWSVFRLVPFAGEALGFVLALNDDDTLGSAEQETQVAHRAGARLTEPRTWGVLVLEPPPH